MNPEKFTQPIVAESVGEHENVLQNRLAEIQLEYVDRLFQRKIPLPERFAEGVEPKDLYDLLSRYTSVLSKLMGYHVRREESQGVILLPDMYDSVEKEFADKITQFYQNDHGLWIEKTMHLLSEEHLKAESKSVNTQEEVVQGEENRNNRGEAGLIHFVVHPVHDWFKDFKDVDIQKDDFCMSIHLESLFKKTLTGETNNIFSSQSLEKLALEIVDHFPETRAIVGRSWLMDTPIAKRIGFTVYKNEYDLYENNPSFWGQFLNSTGQVDAERLAQFLETGKPSYVVSTGVITVEDFLRKYLPKERKGEIILKEVDRQFAHKHKQDMKILKEVGDKWDSLSNDQIKSVFDRLPTIQEFMKEKHNDGFLVTLLKFKDDGLSKDQVDKKMDEIFGRAFKDFIKKKSFEDKKVIID
jgi:hypothetical protein